MLDIAFYSQDREEAEAIEVSNDFYEWLARSEFARIGKSELKEMKVDGEPVEVPVIALEGINRRHLSDFFLAFPGSAWESISRGSASISLVFFVEISRKHQNDR
jgi:hypothetical protein